MSSRTRKNIGLIGLGVIGSRVREVLRNKGFHIFVWNRTPRTVPNFVGAPAELAEMCDFIQIFVSDDDALLYVAKQLSPGLGARHVVMAHSTVSPQTIHAAAEVVERRGARFIDAPFTGSKGAAEKGELVYYLGGDPAAIREARPVLEASSKEILEIGGVGQATMIKVATNMVTAATVQSAAEALALMKATGLPLEKFAAAMERNASNSTTLSMKLPKMIQRNFEKHFSVQHMLKDMQIASRLGLSHHLELAVTAAARDRLLEQMQRGYGDEDYSAVARKYFQDAHPEQPAESDLELFRSPPPPAAVPVPESVAASAPEKSEPEPEQPVAAAAASEQTGAATAERRPVAVMAEPAPAEKLAETPSPNPVLASEAKPQHEKVEQQNGEAGASADTPRSFLEKPTEPSSEEESQSSRGFFGRLLRRAGDY
jgi:3-hydroxyisobutyrate dehydrogenase-like beta-hydroxyacid dehydrogenase